MGYKFHLHALHDRQTDIDTKYIKEDNFCGFKDKKIGFTMSTLAKGIAADIVILSHINLLFFARLIKIFSPKTKIILIAHGIEVWRALPNWKKNFLQRSVEIWAVSSYTAITLTEMHQINAQKIKVVNNCLDPYFKLPYDFEKSIQLLNQYGLEASQPILFTLTRLSSQETYKGYDRVLEAMPSLLKKFPNLHYILAGKADDKEKQRVASLIEKLGLSKHITLAGFIKDEELTDYFKLGIFVMPSTLEGFGIVFIEAAACGAKVIAGKLDGSTDALLNGALGTLVDPHNIGELATAIENDLMLQTNPKDIQDLCLANFGFEQYLKKIKNLLELS